MDFLGGDSDSEVDFTINEKYAKRYEKWRRGEEIQKLKDKYGDVEDSESTSSEEDEDGKELTEDVEKQFFKTLSCLKQKSPKIYDQNVRFFEKKESNIETKTEKQKSEQPLTIAGYQRKLLLETEGQLDDSEEHEEKPFEMMSSQDQERDIKQSFKDILQDSDNEDEEHWGNLFTRRVKTEAELEKEEEDYKKWLAGENVALENTEVKSELKGLHDYWADPKLDEGEKFLRDYILNKRYLEHEDKNRIPSYDEIVHDSDSNLSADEKMINEQDEFERKYNFRFEEPDRDFIKHYPRTMEQSMRKKDDKRKKRREELKQRKQAERSKKDEELKRLKSLKKKEIMDKIKKLQHITGNEDIAFQTEDLEGDFDPEEHDKRMSQIFNDDYYGGGGDEEDKPEFPENDEELEIENWDNWERPYQEEEELHCEDPGFNMDCDYDPTKKKELQKELIENSRRRKRRKKSKFAEALEREKPAFDPRDKTYEQYIDEYYALDYEDLIGDIPCRFKYRKVVPNDYGLSIEEILNATDQELNRWVSLKKITRRLPEHVEKYDVKAYKRKAANLHKKAKCFPSLYGPKPDDWGQQQNIVEDNQDLKQSEEKMLKYPNYGQSSIATESTFPAENLIPKEKKKRKRTYECDTEQSVVSDNVGKENNLNEHVPDFTEEKRKKKKKKKQKIGVENSEPCHQNGIVPPENVTDSCLENAKKKKRKKKSIEQTGHETNNSDQVSHSKKRKSDSNEDTNILRNNKKRKFNHTHQKNKNVSEISDERLRSYGLNPKKYKNKLKYKNKGK